MATILFLHAHPDDESTSTGGAMVRAAAEGHRTILVTATDGAEGEVPDGFLDDGELLEDRRRRELADAAAILAVDRLVLLGYRDSGMMGTSANDHPDCFWQADVDEAAQRLAAILVEEQVDVMTVYDENGGYGHPDHIMVHRVGRAAAELAGTARVFEATMNRDRVVAMMQAMESSDVAVPEDVERPTEEITFGSPDAVITTAVDVHDHLSEKRSALVAHASQVAPDSWFLKLPDDVFAAAFGTEWFIRVTPPFEGVPAHDRESWLLPA